MISISGPPDPDFAREIAATGFVRLIIRLLSSGIRRKAKRRQVSYSFLFMKPSERQLGELARLIDAGAIRAVVDRIFPFESTNEAMTFLDSGRAKGKVVIQMK